MRYERCLASALSLLIASISRPLFLALAPIITHAGNRYAFIDSGHAMHKRASPAIFSVGQFITCAMPTSPLRKSLYYIISRQIIVVILADIVI